MKPHLILIPLWQFLFVAALSAQTPPQALKYQAIARDNTGALITSRPITVRFSILEAFATGTMLYQERHNVSTNEFGLFDVSIGTGVVIQGTFSSIDWGSGEKYLKMEMDPAGGTSYSEMGTSQLVSVPYALYAARAGNGGSLDDAYNSGGAGTGRVITANAGVVEVNTSTGTSALLGNNLRTTGGSGIAGSGYNGLAGSGSGLQGFAVFGENTSAASGTRNGNNYATGMGSIGFFGMLGQTQTNDGVGVMGINFATTRNGSVNNAGVEGEGFVGVIGSTNTTTGTPGWGVYSFGALGTSTNVNAQGNIVAGGTKSFRIDDPLDPANKFLRHFALESNEVLNMYRGTVQLNSSGEALIALPDYFEAVNMNYSYHFNAIGAPAPDLYVKNEIENNRFTLAGGRPGMKVSWQVIAERNDPYMAHHPEEREDVMVKPTYQAGKYVHPLDYGKTQADALLPLTHDLLSPLQKTSGQ